MTDKLRIKKMDHNITPKLPITEEMKMIRSEEIAKELTNHSK